MLVEPVASAALAGKSIVYREGRLDDEDLEALREEQRKLIREGETIILVHVDLLDVLVRKLQNHLFYLSARGLDVGSHVVVGSAGPQHLLPLIKQRIVESRDVNVIPNLLQLPLHFRRYHILLHRMLLQVVPELYLRRDVLITQLLVFVHHTLEYIVPMRQRQPFETCEVLIHHFRHLRTVRN